MAVEESGIQKIPAVLPTWEETTRRCADLSEDLIGHTEDPDPHPQYVLETDALAVFAYASYAGMVMRAITPFTVDATWRKIDVFDTLDPPGTRGITASLANSTLTFDIPGIYCVTSYLSMGHNAIGAGRQLEVRLNNLTTGTPRPSLIVPTAANSPATLFSLSIVSEIGAAEAGDEFDIEIFTSATYSSFQFNSAAWQAFNVGEYRGPLPSDP